MSRRGLATTTLMVLLILPGAIQAAPKWVSVTFADVDTSTTMGVSWAGGGTTVEYGTAPGALTETETATTVDASGIGTGLTIR